MCIRDRPGLGRRTHIRGGGGTGGGAGAVFWMWISALMGSSTAFIEATLSQLYKQKDPLYGGYRGGPAYYIHQYACLLYTSLDTQFEGGRHARRVGLVMDVEKD